MADTFEHDTWLYSAEFPKGKLFAEGDELPGEGWVDHPDLVGAEAPKPKRGKKAAADVAPSGEPDTPGVPAEPEADA